MDIAINEILQALKTIDNKINQIDIRLINMEIEIKTILKLRRESIHKGKKNNIAQLFDYPKNVTDVKIEEGSLDYNLLNEYREIQKKRDIKEGKKVVDEEIKDESD